LGEGALRGERRGAGDEDVKEKAGNAHENPCMNSSDLTMIKVNGALSAQAQSKRAWKKPAPGERREPDSARSRIAPIDCLAIFDRSGRCLSDFRPRSGT
jgi:hypothetical protein